MEEEPIVWREPNSIGAAEYDLPPLQHPMPDSEQNTVKSSPNGAALNGNGKSPNLKSPNSLFWQHPLNESEEINWFVPPLPHRAEENDKILSQLGKLQGMMSSQPFRGWLLEWNYLTRSSAAAAEQVDVEHIAEHRHTELQAHAEVQIKKLDDKISSLRDRERSLEEQLAEAEKVFAAAASAAGISLEPHQPAPIHHPKPQAKPSASQSSQHTITDSTGELVFAPSGINPLRVEDALRNEVPDLDAVAGQHGVSPIAKTTLVGMILAFLMQVLAPLVCGFMLALSLGTLVGILDLDDFSRRDSGPKFILAALLGFVIVYLLGEIFAIAIHALARALEKHDSPSNSSDGNESYTFPETMQRSSLKGLIPRMRVPSLKAGTWIAVGLIVIAMFLAFAEIVAEAHGIRELHNQQLARRDRFRVAASNSNPTIPSEGVPMYIFMIIGTLISGPYIFYKSAKSWGESDALVRESWLLHQQRYWLDERRARPEVGEAFQHACRVEQLEKSLHDTKVDLRNLETRLTGLQNIELDATTQVRRKEARSAAVGEALRLQSMLEEIVNHREPLTTGGSRSSAIPVQPRASGSTIWKPNDRNPSQS